MRVGSRITEVMSGISERTIKPAVTVTNQPKEAFLEKQVRKHNKISSINLSIGTSHLPESMLSL